MESGYAKNVPGAPMCACIEQMPTIEKVLCRCVGYLKNDNSITGTNTASVTYEDCDVDYLKSYYAGTGAEKAEIDKYLVGAGGCTEATTNFLNDMFLVPTDIQLHVVDSDKLAAFTVAFRNPEGKEQKVIMTEIEDGMRPKEHDRYYLTSSKRVNKCEKEAMQQAVISRRHVGAFSFEMMPC